MELLSSILGQFMGVGVIAAIIIFRNSEIRKFPFDHRTIIFLFLETTFGEICYSSGEKKDGRTLTLAPHY